MELESSNGLGILKKKQSQCAQRASKEINRRKVGETGMGKIIHGLVSSRIHLVENGWS